MFSFKLRSTPILALIPFVMGFVIALLLMSDCNNHSVKTHDVLTPKIIQKMADSINKDYQVRIDLLEGQNELLQNKITSYHNQLIAVRSKAKSKEKTIKNLIAPKGFAASELLEKEEAVHIPVDSSLTPCDSLAEQTAEYMQITATKDSLYELQINTLDNLITVKDSVIEEKTNQYEQTSVLLKQSLALQENLLSDNRKLEKKSRRQKRGNRLLVIGAAILSAFTTDYLTHK